MITVKLRFKPAGIAGFIVCLIGLTGCFGHARNTINTGLGTGSQRYVSGTTQVGTKFSARNSTTALDFGYSSYMVDSEFGGEVFFSGVVGSKETVKVSGGTDFEGLTDRVEFGIGWMYRVPDIEFGEVDVLFGLWDVGPRLRTRVDSISYYISGAGVGARARFYLPQEVQADAWFIMPELRVLVPGSFMASADYEAPPMKWTSDPISSVFACKVGLGIYHKIDENVNLGLGFNYFYTKVRKADFPEMPGYFPKGEFTSQEFFFHAIFDW